MNATMRDTQEFLDSAKLQAEKESTAARLSLSELGKLPKDNLRAMARGWIPAFSRMSKPELASAIFVRSNPLREALAFRAVEAKELDKHLNKLVLPEDAPANVHELADLVANLLVDFFNATPDREHHDSDFSALAVSIADHIKRLKLEPGSKSGYKVKFFKLLSGLLADCQETVQERARSILAERFLDSVVTREMKGVYEKMNSLISMNTQRKPSVEIKGQPILDWAEKILSNPTAHGISIEHLSFAIAAATGRRMIEIHHSGTFELIGDDEEHILFSGQAKLKSRQAYAPESYEIPVLVPTPLVMEAVRVLRDDGGFWDEPDGKQQKTAAVRMGRIAPSLNHLWGVKSWEVERIRSGLNGENVVKTSERYLTHSSMRKVYAQVIVYHYADNMNHAVQIIRKALGHTSDAPGDEQSISSVSFTDYIDDFLLTDFNKFAVVENVNVENDITENLDEDS